jgi:hypothetical protein
VAGADRMAALSQEELSQVTERDGCVSGGAATSSTERRWPLSASCLQTRRLAASGPLPRLATIRVPSAPPAQPR